MAGTTTVQRKTLVGALVLAAALGAGGIALVSTVDDGPGGQRISDVETTTTTVEELVTTSEVSTTEPVVETTAAPTTAAPVTAAPAPAAPAPLEQRVEEHEERITDLEATTTTTGPKPTTTTSSTTQPVRPDEG